MIDIGSRISFRPSGWTDYNDPVPQQAVTQVQGEVVRVHRPHRWYRVRYYVNGLGPCYECFKF